MTYSFLSVALSGGSIIDLDGTIFLQLVLFLTAFLLLRALVFRPLLAVFDARDAATGGKVKGAEDLHSQAREAEEQMRVRLEAAKREASAQADSLKAAGTETAEQLVSRTRTEVDAHLSKSLGAIDEKRKAMENELEGQAVALSRQIAQAMLGRGLKS